MRDGKIAVIGDRDVVLSFKTIGLEVFSANNAQEAEKQLKSLAKTYSVIYITDNYADELSELLDKYKSKQFPIIVPLPSVGKSSNYGMRELKKNVEKAVGVDILFK